MPRCSIVIPVYNHATLTRQCLDSVLATSPQPDAEIIVVDDGSTDATPALLAAYDGRLQVVRHAQNTGFAATCNDGAAKASGEFVIFLNNDIIAKGGWLEALVRYADAHPSAAVVGSKLLFPNGTIQHAGVTICLDGYPRHLYAGFEAAHPAVSTSRQLQAVTAACALMRLEAFTRMGGFDEQFRSGYEDVDLCLRMRANGYEVHYCHESVLEHLESVTRDARRVLDDAANDRLYRSRWIGQVEPDELQLYIEDGLLRLTYADTYPVRLWVSPLLATLQQDSRLDRLLDTRARQAFELMQRNIRLTVAMRER